MRKILRQYKGWLFVLPSFIGFAILYLIPFIGGIRYSVSESGFDMTFVGAKNYIELFHNSAFMLAFKNSLVFMGISIPLIMIISFIVALMIHEIDAPKWVRLFIILPIVIPSATSSGFFNKVFTAFEGAEAFQGNHAMFMIVLIFIWRNLGYNLIIYLAGLSQMDKAVIESAKIDGANYFQRLWHMVIPLMTPTTVFVGIISIINSFKVYKDMFVLYGSHPNTEIYMLQHYMNNTFGGLKYERLTTAAYIFSVIIFAGAIFMFLMDKRFDKRMGDVQ